MGCVAVAQVRQSGFDPSQAVAQMAASRQQARVARRFGSAPTRRAGQSSLYRAQGLNETSLYTQAASPAQRAAAETQNRAQLNADRQQQLRQLQNTALPLEATQILESAPDVAQDEEVRELIEDYREKSGSLAGQILDRAVGDPVRRAYEKKKQQLKDDLVNKIKESEIYKRGKKKVSEWLWRIFGPVGEAAESEGALAWTETTFGGLVNQFQAWKTIIMPPDASERPGDPNTGKIFKGFLGFLEPERLDPKDPATWMVDAPMAAIGFFVLFAIHLTFLEFLTIIGICLLILIGVFNLHASMITLGASLFGLSL
jgi:hypothetical protein